MVDSVVSNSEGQLKILIDAFNQMSYLGYIAKQKLGLEVTLKSIEFSLILNQC